MRLTFTIAFLFACCSGSEATARTVQAPAQLELVCDGRADATQALQQWITSLGPGDRGVLPSGECRFSRPLLLSTSGVAVVGAGPYQSVLVYEGDATSGDLIQIGDGTQTVKNLFLADFRITSATPLTAGAAIHARRLVRSMIERVVIDGQDGAGNLWNGIWFDGVDQIVYRGFDIKAQNDGLMVNGVVGDGPRANLIVGQGKIMRGKVGLRVGGGFGGLLVDQIDIIGNDRNVVIDNSLARAPNRELMFGSLVTLDSAKVGPAVTLADGMAGPNSWLQLSGTWVASGATDGLYVAPGVQWTVSVQGGTIFNFKRDGVRNESAATAITINGAVIRHNRGWGVNNLAQSGDISLQGVTYLRNGAGLVQGVARH